MTRDELGRVVRQAWVAWAREQFNPKESWLAPWEELPEVDREADRRIGEAVRAAVLASEGATILALASATNQVARVPRLATERRAAVSETQAPYETNPNADEPRPGRPDLAAIRARAEAATPGRMSRVKPITARYWTIGRIVSHQAEPLTSDADWHYAEAAWVAVPALLAYCERLEAAGDRLAEGLDEEGWGETDSVVAWRAARGEGG